MRSDEIFRGYVEEVCRQIRWKKVRPAVGEELTAHLIDQQQAFLDAGMEEEEAARESVRQMGDPVSAGAQLDQVHRPKAQWGLLIAAGVILLIGFGFTLLANLLRSANVNPARMASSYVAAALLLLGCYFLDFSSLGKRPVLLNCIFLAAITFLSLNNSAYYAYEHFFRFRHFMINLAYLSLLVPLFYSLLIYRYRGRGYRGILYCSAWLLPYLAFLAFCKPYAGMFLALVCCLLLLFMAIWKGWFWGQRWKEMALAMIPAVLYSIPAVGAIFLQEDYRTRWHLLFHPETDPPNVVWMLRELLKNARFIGHGEPVDFLDTPLASASHLSGDWDYFLALFVYDFGWIVLLAIAAVLILFIILAFRQIRRLTNDLSRLISHAILFTLIGQCVFYLLDNLGWGLVSSISLPLISPGNAALLIDTALVGFLLSVFRTGEAYRTTAPAPYETFVSKLRKARFPKRT